jgi:hypothetical protein
MMFLNIIFHFYENEPPMGLMSAPPREEKRCGQAQINKCLWPYP